MPVPGRPLTDGPKHNRVAATHDWIDVEDVPFTGEVPVELPSTRVLVTKDGAFEVPLERMTVGWWAALVRMPHCSLWSDTDWQFALSTAMVADMAFRGSSPASGELRQREKILGTTLDSRRALRIRYVPKAVEEKPATGRSSRSTKSKGTVTSLDSRRGRLAGAS